MKNAFEMLDLLVRFQLIVGTHKEYLKQWIIEVLLNLDENLCFQKKHVQNSFRYVRYFLFF